MKLKLKIMLLVVLPAILIGTIVTSQGSKQIRNSMHELVKEELNTATNIGLMTFEFGVPGLYKYEDNIVSRGEMQITGNYEAVDKIKKNCDVEATFFYGDERVSTSIKDKSGKRLVGTKASSEVVEEVLKKGNTYFSEKTMINGAPYYAYYIPIKQQGSDEILGMFFAGKPSASVNAMISKTVMSMVVISVIITVLAIIVAILICSSITRALKRTVSHLGELSNGKLNVDDNKKDLRRRDEIGDIARGTLHLKESLINVITQISNTSDVLSKSSKDLNLTTKKTNKTMEGFEKAIIDISTGAMSQAEETQSATNHVISMGDNIETTVKNVDDLTSHMNVMKQSSNEAISILEELNITNQKTKQAITEIYNETNATNESAQQIKAAADFIKSIAEETNLLSLNAAIEAARAGEFGRGFAVVASEIQKLAAQSDTSAKQIEEIINGLLSNSEKAVLTMDEVSKIMDAQIKDMDKTKEKFNDVEKQINECDLGVTAIATGSDELSNTRTLVVDIVQNLAAIAEENAASTEETTSASEELAETMSGIERSSEELDELAKELIKEIEIFTM